jgi:hypothetical protein
MFTIAERGEQAVVDTGQKILLKTADGTRRAKDCLADPRFIESDKRAITFLNFDDAILDGHARMIATTQARDNLDCDPNI